MPSKWPYGQKIFSLFSTVHDLIGALLLTWSNVHWLYRLTYSRGSWFPWRVVGHKRYALVCKLMYPLSIPDEVSSSIRFAFFILSPCVVMDCENRWQSFMLLSGLWLLTGLSCLFAVANSCFVEYCLNLSTHQVWTWILTRFWPIGVSLTTQSSPDFSDFAGSHV